MSSNLTKEISHLIRKEILLEWRQRSSFGGMLLYVVSTVFVCYLAFKGVMDMSSWIALFWIILLFASVNAAAKSFMHESRSRNLYYYSIADPRAIILSKVFYNFILLSIICALHLTFYTLLMGTPMTSYSVFLITAFLGSSGLAITLTLVSAIASKAGSNTTLMAILGFPILLPILLVCIKLSRSAALGMDVAMAWKFLLVLLCLNIVVGALSFILFPYLWRE